VRVFVDGAANDLTSGVGYWAHQAGQLLLLESVTLKEALTPIELELLACGLALLALARCGLRCEPIVLYVDNPDVARWLQGRTRPKRRERRELVEQVRGLVRRFPNLRVRYQPRERNLRAHRLARRGMREGVGAPWRP
jgi:ribonuclease HI